MDDSLTQVILFFLVWLLFAVVVLLLLAAVAFHRNMEHLPAVAMETKRVLLTRYGVSSYTYDQVYEFLQVAMLHSAIPYVLAAIRSGNLLNVLRHTYLTPATTREVAEDLAATIANRMV